ncbi:hypothetical protein ACWGN5_17655 [Streptomyces sp. NPDC055815]
MSIEFFEPPRPDALSGIAGGEEMIKPAVIERSSFPGASGCPRR